MAPSIPILALSIPALGAGIPRSWEGLAPAILLMLLGLALVIAELWVSSGLLAATGVMLLAMGTFTLFGVTPVPLRLVLPAAALLAIAAVLLVLQLRRTQRLPQRAADAGLLGEEGRALEPIDEAHGAAFVHGERWTAHSSKPIPPNARVRVRSVRGLTLEVEELRT